MVTQSPTHSEQKYNRDFLLSPEKRNQLIELWEVEKYGSDCFGDPDHVHLYRRGNGTSAASEFSLAPASRR
jgi:hypothetical protein